MNSRSWSQLAAGSKLETIRCSSLVHSMNVLIFCVKYERARLNIFCRDWFDESQKKEMYHVGRYHNALDATTTSGILPSPRFRRKSASILNWKF